MMRYHERIKIVLSIYICLATGNNCKDSPIL
jgi:hypothetical protein